MNHQAKKVVEAMKQHNKLTREAFSQLNQHQQLQMARQGYEMIISMAGEEVKIWNILNLIVEGSDDNPIPIRVYQPSSKEQLPILFYIHGGGFISGSLETHDRPLRKLANQSGFVVVAIDYRLAPEHPFPAALNDCFYILNWIETNAKKIKGDTKNIFIGGDSAGGNLATVTAIKNRDEGTTSIAGQILIYPNTDLHLKSDSWDELGDKGYVLTKAEMAKNVNYYINSKVSLSRQYVSPLYADNLSDLPATLIITGGYDPLCSEGMAYARKLEKHDVSVTHWHYKEQIHGFFQLGGMISEGMELITRIGDYLSLINKTANSNF